MLTAHNTRRPSPSESSLLHINPSIINWVAWNQSTYAANLALPLCLPRYVHKHGRAVGLHIFMTTTTAPISFQSCFRRPFVFFYTGSWPSGMTINYRCKKPHARVCNNAKLSYLPSIATAKQSDMTINYHSLAVVCTPG